MDSSDFRERFKATWMSDTRRRFVRRPSTLQLNIIVGDEARPAARIFELVDDTDSRPRSGRISVGIVVGAEPNKPLDATKVVADLGGEALVVDKVGRVVFVDETPVDFSYVVQEDRSGYEFDASIVLFLTDTVRDAVARFRGVAGNVYLARRSLKRRYGDLDDVALLKSVRKHYAMFIPPEERDRSPLKFSVV